MRCTFIVLRREPKTVLIQIKSIDNFQHTRIFQETPKKYFKAFELQVPISVISYGKTFERLNGRESRGGPEYDCGPWDDSSNYSGKKMTYTVPWRAYIWDEVLFSNIKKMIKKRMKAEKGYRTPGDEVDDS